MVLLLLCINEFTNFSFFQYSPLESMVAASGQLVSARFDAGRARHGSRL